MSTLLGKYSLLQVDFPNSKQLSSWAAYNSASFAISTVFYALRYSPFSVCSQFWAPFWAMHCLSFFCAFTVWRRTLSYDMIFTLFVALCSYLVCVGNRTSIIRKYQQHVFDSEPDVVKDTTTTFTYDGIKMMYTMMLTRTLTGQLSIKSLFLFAGVHLICSLRRQQLLLFTTWV